MRRDASEEQHRRIVVDIVRQRDERAIRNRDALRIEALLVDYGIATLTWSQ